jgi:hypothetical protein
MASTAKKSKSGRSRHSSRNQPIQEEVRAPALTHEQHLELLIQQEHENNMIKIKMYEKLKQQNR